MTHPVREYREQRNLSQQEFGKAAGLSTYAVHRIEAGKIRDLSLSVALAIKRATGGLITPEALAENQH